jgi:hypothetical protein
MMEDAKTSVDEQLSQIDAKLALEPVSTSEDVQPAQVLSSDGIQDADVDPAHDPIASEPLEPTLGDEMQSEAPHAAGVPELEAWLGGATPARHWARGLGGAWRRSGSRCPHSSPEQFFRFLGD